MGGWRLRHNVTIQSDIIGGQCLPLVRHRGEDVEDLARGLSDPHFVVNAMGVSRPLSAENIRNASSRGNPIQTM